MAGARVAVFDRTIPDDFANTHPDVIPIKGMSPIPRLSAMGSGRPQQRWVVLIVWWSMPVCHKTGQRSISPMKTGGGSCRLISMAPF